METTYARAHDSNSIASRALSKGEVLKYGFDWNNYLGFNASATVSSSVWASDNTSVAVSGATNSGGVTGATVTGAERGHALVKNTVTLSNGETLVRRLYVSVRDPENSYLAGDYRE